MTSSPSGDVDGLVDSLAVAIRGAVEDLRATTGETFTWWGLVLTGDGAGPTLTAWSEEALAERSAAEGVAPQELRWSYADSPHHPAGEDHLDQVRALLEQRGMPAPEDGDRWGAEIEARLGAMEAALARLDAEGLFGSGRDRDRVVLTAGLVPPDASDVDRVRRLNPAAAFDRWFEQAAETDVADEPAGREPTPTGRAGTPTSPAVEIREARPGDLERVGALTARAYVEDGLVPEEHPYVDELRDAVRRGAEATVLVAVEAGAVVGTVTLTQHGSPYAEVARPGEAEIRMLAVEPAARGRGIGERLVVAAAERATDAGVTTFVLSSLVQMTTAHRVYARLGMVRVPERDWQVEGYSMLVFAAPLPLGRG